MLPDILISDNGPQFSSTLFQQFSKDYGFQHHTSSPYHPQSNRIAKKAVQTINNILRKVTEDKKVFYLAPLDLRNTPITKDTGKDLWGEEPGHCYLLQIHFLFQKILSQK